MSVARVRALLSHQAGVWRLDPLPGGTKTEAVAAALQLQQEGSGALLWGGVELTTLLGELQVGGLVCCEGLQLTIKLRFGWVRMVHCIAFL
jgi:hypothetical protein